MFTFSAKASEPRRIGVLLDELPNAPMRVEADEFAEIVANIVAEQNAAQPDSCACELLVPTASGVATRENAPADLHAYDAIVVYQGDEIVQTTSLFSDAVVKQLAEFCESSPERGVVLAGGAAALLESLGYGTEQKLAPMTFGEDRAQSGVIPLDPNAKLFDGVDLDRGVVWITNAGFPAFASFSTMGPNVATYAACPIEGEQNPLMVGIVKDKGQPRAKAFTFGWRVSPLFDAAPDTYRANYQRLIANMTSLVGQIFDISECKARLYDAPDFAALERALDAYAENFDEEEIPRLEEFVKRLEELKARSESTFSAIGEKIGANVMPGEPELKEAADELKAQGDSICAEFAALQKDALLASPELDFDSLLFVRRDPAQMGLPDNYNSNSVIPTVGYRDELCKFNLRSGETNVVYKPEHGEFVGDLELYYDASKVMFSSPDVNANNRWRLWELELDENGNASDDSPKIAPLINDPDVDNYDGCYLPDDRVVFCSTASMTGVPCINGSGHVCCLYLKEKDGSIRQLTVEQDHDWNPVVMNNGRVMYLRWEYVDLPHCFSRIMFHMNPDGTNQSELYGSGSYWPNCIFYARPLPGDSSKFVGIVTGHHELKRIGDMVIFDPAKGRKEASGAVQRVPGYEKKVEPIACDLPIAQNWPKFIHPFPISDTLFLVSCKRSPSTPWEICLVDTFDNIVPILSEPTNAVLEPIPLRETERQPIIADRVDPKSPTADVFIADVYEGEGLKGVPRGEVKALRIFSYQFAYQGMGAEPYSVGLDGPWDPRRIIGTVPVNEDGSASFKIPAYVPIALQPLDKDGKAIQIMRSWITALPGESVSCIGCHESQNSTGTTNPRAMASEAKPVDITPFYGETRGFGFESEIQPILDRYCVECHQPDSPKIADMIAKGELAPEAIVGTKRPNDVFETIGVPDFRKSDPVCALTNGSYIAQKSPISNSYYQLRRFVRTLTKESQMPPHRPYDLAADTTLLVQILESHHGVELDPVSWAKLYTWIDLNAPYNGSWGEMIRDNQALVKQQFSRREELRKLYAPSSKQLDDDPNAPAETSEVPETNLRVRFKSELTQEDAVVLDASQLSSESVALADGVALELVKIPNSKISVGKFEITNEQYKLFDPAFDSGIEFGDFIQFSPGERGWLLSRKSQPVARVTYKDAEAFCAWLSEKTGQKYRLPTLAEERAFACAEDAAFAFGDASADYSAFENLADSTHGLISPFGWTGRVETLPPWRPVDWNVNDYCRVSAPVGSYKPNKLGLYDVQGNVGEWTSTDRVDTRSIVDIAENKVVEESKTAKKVVAGGSWLMPARYSGVDSVRAFPEFYDLRDVGFRVVREDK